MKRRALFPALLLAAATAFATGPNVLTHHYDTLRTGANTNETLLTPANVNSAQFGKLFDQSVDGQVYGQPLYVAGVTISGTVHNVIYVVTQHDSVYAFDADSNTGANATPLWQTSFINPGAGITTVSSTDVNSDDIYPEIGITSTPVIDPATSTIYVVAKTKENGVFFQRLHALDIATGDEKANSPVVITGTVAGTGDDSSGGVVSFNPLRENQRAGLLLLNGVVYIAWSSHGDNTPVHGWIIGYNAQSLARVAAFNTTPNGSLATIWMSGCGLSADAEGNIYCSTGNGTFDTNSRNEHIGIDYGDSLLKVSTSGSGLALTDYFTPANQALLNDQDLDFGSGGVMLLPDQPGPYPHLGIVTGKQNITFLFNRDKLGGYLPNNAGVHQAIIGAIPGSFGTPAYFNGHIYYHGYGQGGDDVLKSFAIGNGYLDPTPSSTASDLFIYPGATPSVSAHGTANGIVWEIEHVSPAILFAYNANDVGQRLYTSEDAADSRDEPGGNGVKFTTPTVTNGKVYIGTDSTLTVFGLLRDTTPLTVNISGSGSVTNGFAGVSDRQTNSTFTITATPAPGSVFKDWTDGGGNLISRSPAHTFTMSENLVLNANFVPYPAAGIPGYFFGLIQGSSPNFASAGFITLAAGRNRDFTTAIHFGGSLINLGGFFDANGAFSTTAHPPALGPVAVSLALDGIDDLTGTVSSASGTGNISAAPLVDAANPLPASLIGRYTFLFPVPSGPGAPQGIGFGTATVDKYGHARLVGILGDGGAFSEAATLTQAQTWPIFAGLYGGRGLITGILTFENTGASNIDGPLFWYKPVPGSQPLSMITNAIGSVYNSAANPILPLTTSTGALTFQLPSPILQPIVTSHYLSLRGSAPISLKFYPADGFFGGAFFTGGVVGTYGGALFQDQNIGQGTYFLSGSGGAVNLQ